MIKYHPYFTGKIYTLRSQEKEKKDSDSLDERLKSNQTNPQKKGWVNSTDSKISNTRMAI
jgi:hypothetical protein